MSATLDEVNARLLAGDDVSDKEIARALAGDDADRVSELRTAAAGKRERLEAERAQAANIDARIAAFAVAADKVTDRLEAAGLAFDAALAELVAAGDYLDEVQRVHLEGLHNTGWKIIDPSEVHARTNGRVVLMRDQLQRMKLRRVDGTEVRLPDAARYVAWARAEQANR